MKKYLQRVFLKESDSLYRQVMLGFGTAAVSTLACVMCLSIVMLRIAGNIVQDQASEVMNAQIIENLAETTESMAQTVGRTFRYYEGVIELLSEIALDRIVGYPEPGWETDQFVPFFDMDSQTNKYPLKSPPVPLDWNISLDITMMNIQEVAPGREKWVGIMRGHLCFSTGSYFMQGQCDPSVLSPAGMTSSYGYAPNCTEDHNNIETGGVVAPTELNRHLHSKSAEIMQLFRPLFEQSAEASSIGIYFHNGGAGSMAQYPGSMVDGSASSSSSYGCDWMRETINPYTGRPMGTEEDIARCHPTDAPVPPREYNPNEREWFQLMAKNFGDITWFGPYPWYRGNTVVLSVGKGLFDRRTGNFIGVVALEISLAELGNQLLKAKLYDHSEIGILSAQNGLVIADSRNLDLSGVQRIRSWFEDGLLPQSTFDEIKKSFDKLLLGHWEPESIKAALKTMSFVTRYGLAVVHPLPLVPSEYDENYKPHYFVIHMVTEQVFQATVDFEDSVDRDFDHATYNILGIGICGTVFVFSILWLVASRLTHPLLWMGTTSWSIVNHADKNVNLETGIDKEIGVAARCTPHTEIRELVSGFRRMIMGFSGEGASRVANPFVNDVRNILKWQSNFRDLYKGAAEKKTSIWSMKSDHETPTTVLDDLSDPSASLQTTPVTSASQEPTPSFHAPSDSSRTYRLAESENTISRLSTNQTKLTIQEDGYTGRDCLTMESDDCVQEENARRRDSKPHESLDPNGLPLVKGPLAQPQMLSMSLEEDSTERSLGLESPVLCEGFLTEEGTSAVPNLETLPDPKDVQQVSIRNETEDISKQSKTKRAFHSPRDAVGPRRGSTVPKTKLIERASELPTVVFPAPKRQHLGHNVIDAYTLQTVHVDNSREIIRSELFRWIVLLIVIPLVCTSLGIAANVSHYILSIIPDWVNTLGDESTQVEIRALRSVTQSKAGELKTILREPMRDMYLLYRVAGWLHFGALSRSESFTDVLSATEQCKLYPGATCPVLETDQYPCPCSWGESPLVGTCVDYNKSHARLVQRRWFTVSKLDHDPETGARNNSNSFPDFAYSAETTSWWSNTEVVPGSHKGRNASGFATTYDRLRVSSALAVVEFPIHNYAMSLGIPDPTLGTYAGYEAEGLFTGFNGCRHSTEKYAQFVSSERNRAYQISEALCPKDKYGYDPRCRAWYDDAKQKYNDTASTLHMTAPYEFAVHGGIGLAASSPIANPITNEFVGVVLLDFAPYSLKDAVSTLSQEISFIASPKPDPFGGDTVIGVNKSKSWTSRLVANEILPYDAVGSPLWNEFDSKIVTPMRMGKEGNETFRRSGLGIEEEYTKYMMVYAPVVGTSLSAIDPGDWGRGVSTEVTHLYSIGIASAIADMREPFVRVEGDINHDLHRLVIMHLSLVFVFTCFFILVAAKIAILVTKPVIVLLRVVESINSKDKNKALPRLTGGSREVNHVYNSFSKLHKVIHISNTAFYEGNLQNAFELANDALQLFRTIRDRKAIGVACNNLGNVFFAMIIERQKIMGDVSLAEYASQAFQCFDEAVEISEAGFETTQRMDDKAKFALELADRLFNRALLVLFMNGESDGPSETKSRALQDIARVRELDYDVRDYWLDIKMLLNHSEETFLRLLRRIHGLCDHFGMDELREIWDVRELMQEADQLLFAAWSQQNAPLFLNVTREGRLQQLEGAAMRAEILFGNHVKAARMAMRIFAEDEHIVESSFTMAGSALLQYGQKHAGISWGDRTIQSLKSDLRKMVRISRSPSLDLGKCVVFAIELNERWEGSKILDLVREKCLDLFDRHCSDDDFVSIVADTVAGNYTLGLASKADNAAFQRSNLALATTSTSEHVRPSLPFAMQVIMDSVMPSEVDTYLVLLTDGFSWDSEAYRVVKHNITQMNHDRESKIHVIVVGLDVEDEGVGDECEAMGCVSKMSCFMDVNHANIHCTFADIASRMSSRKLVHQKFLSSITMETFG